MSVKKLALYLLCLAFPLPAFATGTFFWTCEATTLGADSYSAGDTTATANGAISISSTSPLKGSNSCLTVDGQDYYIFDSASIASNTEIAFGAMLRWTTTVPATSTTYRPFSAVDSTDDDGIGLAHSGTNLRPRLSTRKEGNGALIIGTASNALAADTTYYLTGGVDIAGDRRFIRLYDSSCSLIEQVEDTSTDLGNDNPGAFDQVRIGNATASTPVLRVDNIVVANDYDDPVEYACGWTSFYPTFSSALSAGTHGPTSLQVTWTPDQQGTAYGVACPDGATATHAQALAGNCSSGAAPASWTEAGTTGVGETKSFTGLSGGTTYDIFVTYVNALGGAKASVSSLADQSTTSSGPGFTNGPNLTPIATGQNVAGTIAGTGTLTVYAVGCSPGDAAPNATEVKAGQCGGGNAAILSANEVWTTTVANDFDLGAANKPVRLAIYVVGSDGSSNTAVESFTDQDRTLRSGFAKVVMASVSATGICDHDAYFTPDCAIGDLFEYEDDTNENADCNVSISTGGDVTLTPVAPGDCDGRQTFEISYEDVSNATDGLFTAPAVGNFVTDDTAYINNSAPECSIEPSDALIVLDEDEAMQAIDLTFLGGCNDADADALTFSVTSGTLPNGTSFGGTGNGTWSGTPDTEDEGGEAITIQACDVAGDCDSFDVLVYVINTWTVPDCVDGTVAACSTLIEAAAPWRISSVGPTITGTDYSDTVAADDIISQDPAASAEAGAFDPIGVVISLGAFGGWNIVGGMAFDGNGRLGTEYLGDAEPVPAGSTFKQGMAYDSSIGVRFVCDWPTDDGVSYHGGIAVRNDGCMTVSDGPVTHSVNGFGMTQRGEVVVTTDNPSTFFNIYGFVGQQLSVTERVD